MTISRLSQLRKLMLLVGLQLMLWSVGTSQSCLDTLSVSDTLIIQQRLGSCSVSQAELLTELGITSCPGIVVFPGGPFSGNSDHSIELLDPANSSRKSFILSLAPLPLSQYGVSSGGMNVSDDVITFPLAAGECQATKNMILDQLQVADDDIIRSNIHFIEGTQRQTDFAIGDTNYIDLIQCNGLSLHSGIKIVFTPQVATTSGFITFDIGLSTCEIGIEQVLERLGYGASLCNIDRFTISDVGPFGYGQTVIESIKLDGFSIVSNATVEINASACPPTTIFYGELGEGKCFLDEYDILDTIGLTRDGRDCNLDNVEITPPGPYMETNTTITSIKINGQEVCSRAFDINYSLNNNIDEQITLFCNDDLNISMGTDCSVEIDADNILRNGAYCFLNYNIDVAYLDRPDDIVVSGHRVEILQPGRYSVTITNPTSGNSCWSLMSVEDKYIEDIRCSPDTLRCYLMENMEPNTSIFSPQFPDLGLGLTYNKVAANTYNITGAGACDITSATYQDTEVAECQGPYKLIFDRLWTFRDDNGNQDTCLQKIFIESAPIALLDKFSVFRGNCLLDFDDLDDQGYPTPEETGYPTVDTFYKADVCGNLKMTYGDTPFPLCGKSLKLARKWTIIDWCSDEVAYLDQVIRIEDTKAPIIIESVEDMILESDPFVCGRLNIDLPLPNYEDCDDDVVIEILYETIDNSGKRVMLSNGSDLRIPSLRMDDIEADFEVIYVLSDQCGNTSYDTTTITIQDTEPPVAVCDQFTVISVNGSGEALIRALTFDDLSVDNCGIASYDARKLEGECYVQDTFTNTIRFCCEEVGDTILVEFRVTDNAGNSNTCMVEVLIQDKFKPIIEGPPDITLDCGTDYRDTTITGSPTYRDNCSGVELIYVDEVDLDACGQGTVRRTWIITDRGEFEESHVQTITLKEDDPFGLEDIQWPEDIVVNGCQETLAPIALGSPILKMENCVSVDASHSDLPFYNVEDACVKILREWTVVDWCQLNKEGATGIWKKVQIIKVESEEGPVFDPRPLETYCIEGDDCNTEVTISGVGTDGDACTPDELLTWSYDLIDLNDNSLITSGDGKTITTTLSEGDFAAIFEAIDACDNAGRDTVRFEVIDCAAPVLECPAVQPSLVLSNIGLASLDMAEILTSATDNCNTADDIRLSFDRDIPTSTIVYTCEDIPDGISSVRFIPIYAIDLSGNIDSCEIMVQLFDNSNNICQDTFMQSVDTAMISGLITTANLMEIENVEVTLTSGENVFTTTTDDKGEFSINDLSTEDTYKVSLYKDGPVLDGVSTSDIVLIQRHLLGLRRITAPYDLIAADANNDGRLSGLDLVVLRRTLLGFADVYPNEQRVWRFVDASQDWDIGEMPFPYREEVDVTPTPEGILDLDFMAIKIGDVNNSNRISRGLSTKGRSIVRLEAIHYEDRIDIVSTQSDGIFGLQLGLEVSQDDITLTEGIIDITTDHYAIHNGTLLISYDHSSSPIKVNKGDVLFSISNSPNISISSQIATEWIANDFSLSEIIIDQKQVSGNRDISIISNHPNPFQSFTDIDFEISQEEDVQVEIIDLSGRTVISSSALYSPGVHTYRFSSDDGGLQAGVYIVRMSTATSSAVHKMTLIR